MKRQILFGAVNRFVFGQEFEKLSGNINTISLFSGYLFQNADLFQLGNRISGCIESNVE